MQQLTIAKGLFLFDTYNLGFENNIMANEAKNLSCITRLRIVNTNKCVPS